MTILRDGIFKLEFAILVIYAIIMIFKKVKLNKLLFNLAFGLYISTVIAMCFFPIRISSLDTVQSVPNNFIPFNSIVESISESVQNHTPYGLISVLGNFVLLIPLGLFFYYRIKDVKRRLLAIVLISVSIETIQFIIGLLIGYNYRSIDIDDFVLNAIGGIISCLFFDFIIKRFVHKTGTDVSFKS